ncbi:hypothetical protein KR222_008070 [Zaprionus bogoriensis]|nr:hypothetical protein KR222_008070 [Zaprionus bogoriensis]
MSVLQSQLIVLKLKETMNENIIKDKEDQLKKQEQLQSKVSSIDKNVEELSAQSRSEMRRRMEMQRQIEEYRVMIEKNNEYIRILQNQLQGIEHTTENSVETLASAYNPSTEMLKTIAQEKYVFPLASSCLSAANSTQILQIKVPKLDPFFVPCDGTIAGPGWTVIQRRVDEDEDFNRNWEDYRTGFGDLNGNFFIGLEKLHRMTSSEPHELYIHLENFERKTRYAHYKRFSIGSEAEAYALNTLEDYSGDAGDAMELNRHMKFSTFDRDNDLSYNNCAVERSGGWWYNQCARSNLNGRYLLSEFEMWDGIWWWNWQEFRTLKSVHMLVRPTNNTLA